MSEINHEIKIESSSEKIFKALCDKNDLKAWHTEHIQEDSSLDKLFIFQGDAKPSFSWKIIPLETNKSVIWECVDGPGDAAGSKVVYTLSETDDGRTLVELKHIYLPDQTENFRKCNTLWAILLHHLKKYIETGKPEPAII